ncbi:hypothetical protein FVEN_g6127 [Fusarium venenatum]|uniref:Zn(2)-C6 fungal-type domain-containing protein n=1 Tax=Fusarium venenatum TaxID=56646 RepID=A0A2L2T3Y0_9HYPO|nr:uncharacterized protein FVRRES_01976 [Fusarium venenatum]KAG8355839.1 hypothetical protein FVEN_g6127 [Fusarium venenatum]KAH7004883.1 fungal-specific transcription factor domain-containing protein [Fusarium venenatum]CEI65464.1 unnamed protein product [Fusarium venenatum]
MSTQTNTSDSVPPPPPRPIRFVHNQGQPPSKRRRINAACLTCRKRKTRCAGERPVCSTCTKNGHRCLGYPEEIKREDVEKLPLDRPGHDRDEHEHHNYHDEDIKVEKVPVHAQHTPDAPTPHGALETTMSLANMIDSKHDTTETPGAPSHNSHNHSSAPAQNTPSPTAVRKSERHRVPYFRYFGPTAIVPGFKQMVVSVRDRRRSTAGSMAGTSPISIHSGPQGSSSVVSEALTEELPTYDPNDPAPVHPLIISLINTFFTQMGSSYPFLRQTKFLRMVKEKRVEPILVDSICALSARFSDSPALTNGNDKMPRMERGLVFAQRARQATVDTFPCPTVGAVQACLLMAYEGFGAGQDSALWMYLGLAIRMAVDLGLQKEVGVQYHGEKDALYSQNWGRQPVDEGDSEAKTGESSHLNPQEQKELVQERMDTFWAVFVLDRVISSGTGRPVTFRDDDLELSIPEPFIDPATNWPAPYPIFLQIIHLYGRVCDVLNKVRNAKDLTKDTWDKLGEMEHELTRLYKNWDWRLQFNVSNFKAYLGAGQGTTFILLHFWFHALFIILHQPTLLTPFAELRTELQLLPDSRELSMSSAKTICDILSFADLIDPKSFIGNPFTCQPIYIAACAFVMESSANASSSPSRDSSPPGAQHTVPAGNKSRDAKSSRHSLLASAANQNYQKCFNSLQQIEMYWGGATYIITALDQRAKGIWDCETYTAEEYESTKAPRRGSNGALNNPFPKFENKASPRLSGPPIAWTLAGTANSPNSSLTLMYQNRDSPAQTGQHTSQPARAPSTPPGNMIFDPIRQSLPDSTNLLAPGYPQPNISAVRQSSRPTVPRRTSNLSATSTQTRPHVQFDGVPEDSESHDFYAGPRFTPTSQPTTGFDAYSVSPPTAMAENGVTPATTLSGANHMYFGHGQNNFPYTMPWVNSMGSMDGITFDSQDIDIAALGLQQSDMMGPWLDYFPSDVLGLLEQQHPHMGQGGH